MTDPTPTPQTPPQGLTDARLLELMPQQFQDDLATVCRLAAYGTPTEPGLYRVSLNTGAVAYARAAIAADRAARVGLAPPQGLTDAQLLELAAREIEPYDRIPPGEYEAEYQRALEVYGSELIAAMRAAIAAHEAARPRLTREEVEARFRAWWGECYPNVPAGGHTVRSHVAFAMHLMGGEVAA